MKVHVKGYLTLRRQMDSQGIIELPEGSTLRDLLRMLPAEILEDAEMDSQGLSDRRGQRPFTILINGHSWRQLSKHLDTILNDGDEIAIFPPLAGGAD